MRALEAEQIFAERRGDRSGFLRVEERRESKAEKKAAEHAASRFLEYWQGPGRAYRGSWRKAEILLQQRSEWAALAQLGLTSIPKDGDCRGNLPA